MAVKVLATLMAGVDGRRELLATWHVVSVAQPSRHRCCPRPPAYPPARPSLLKTVLSYTCYMCSNIYTL